MTTNEGPVTRWGDNVGASWETADTETRKEFALVRLYWFYRMVQCGGPDGSELDAEVEDQAREAAEWLGPQQRHREIADNKGESNGIEEPRSGS